jgi:outer membrane lipoprotein-sorting protein
MKEENNLKKRSAFFFALCFIMVSLVVLPNLVLAVGTSFDADFVSGDAKGKLTTGKIYMVPGVKFRQESAGAITIFRIDQMVVWTLMPDQKQYMEIKLNGIPNAPPSSAAEAAQYDKVSLGTQTINGYLCDGTQYIFKNKSMGSSIIWVSQRLGVAMKTESKDAGGKVSGTWEVKNVKEGPQADSLFEIPAGYTKFVIPGFTMPST